MISASPRIKLALETANDGHAISMSKHKWLCLRLNVICLLQFLIGTTAIVEHPQ